ncbi:MAG: hypothetical protein PUF71_03675 [Firmicutes bacterium]|nr:hypothetical protein [Bacillota bacterium]
MNNEGIAYADPEELAGLAALCTWEEESATLYARLARRIPRHQQTLLTLRKENREYAACLRGIYRLLSGNPPRISDPAVPDIPMDSALLRCFSRELQCAAGYRRRQDHPEFSGVFSQMLREKDRHGFLLLQVLGSLPPAGH